MHRTPRLRLGFKSAITGAGSVIRIVREESEIMMTRFEVVERDVPSYLPAYLAGGMTLLGLYLLLEHPHPLWPVTISHVFFAVWFGFQFAMIRSVLKQRRDYSSQKLSIEDDRIRHTFRYFIEEKDFAEIPISSIQRVVISGKDPLYLMASSSDDEVFFPFPRHGNIEDFVRNIQDLNPSVQIERK